MDQVMDHSYVGEHRSAASCQHMYPDNTVCCRMAGEHGPVPLTQPGLPPTFTITGQIQRYWIHVKGVPPLAAVRDPSGPQFYPDTVRVEWLDGVFAATIFGDRINAQGRTVRDRLLTQFDRDDLEDPTTVAEEVPDWLPQVIALVMQQHAAVQPPADVAAADHTRPPAFSEAELGALLAECTHGADCKVHPDASGLHNRDATAADVLEAVMAAVLIRHKFDADDVREIAARYGIELTR